MGPVPLCELDSLPSWGSPVEAGMKCGEAPVGRAVIGTASNAGIAMSEDSGSVRGTARLKLRAGEAKVFIGGDD